MSRDHGPPIEPPLDPRLGEALRPTEAEARSLAGSTPAWAAPLASATEPGEAEVEALRRRLRAPSAPAPRAGRLVLAGVALLAAAVLLAVNFWPRLQGSPHQPLPEAPLAEAPVAPPSPTLLPSGTLQIISPDEPVLLTADARMVGNAVVEVLTRDPEGARLYLHSGEAVFEVDPQGAARRIVVEAGEVHVTVTGTRFRVARDGRWVEVAVERGSVRVEGPGVQIDLGAGQRWEGPRAMPEVPSGTGAAAETAALAEAGELPSDGGSPSSAGAGEAPGEAETGHRAAAAEWARLLNAREARMPADELLAQVEAFLVAWPDSPLAVEAAYLRVELGMEVWPAEVALTEVEAMVNVDPGSPRWVEANLFRARLLLAAVPARCGDAMPSLIIARQLGSPAVRAEALSLQEKHCPPAGD